MEFVREAEGFEIRDSAAIDLFDVHFEGDALGEDRRIDGLTAPVFAKVVILDVLAELVEVGEREVATNGDGA